MFINTVKVPKPIFISAPNFVEVEVFEAERSKIDAQTGVSKIEVTSHRVFS